MDTDPVQPTTDDLFPIESMTPDPTLLTEVKRKRVVTPITRGLLALVLVAGAFLGGVLLERSQAKTSSSSALPAGLPAGLAALLGGRGANGSTATTIPGATGGAGTSSSTFGTVKLVDGKNVYVSDQQGNVVKIATNATTKISVSKDGTVSELAPTKTIVVQGTKGSDGTIIATQISETQGGGAGGGGGFPTGGFPGGAAGG
jgi:hypothetical protein